MTLVNGRLGSDVAATRARDAADRRRLRLLLVAMTSLLLTAGAVFGRHGLLEVRQYRLERDRLRAEIESLQRANAALEAEIHALKSEPAAIERIAREDLGLARPGEVLVLLEPPRRQDSPLVPTAPGLDALPSAP